MQQPDEHTMDSDSLISLARDHGFGLAGVCSLEPSRRGDALDAWLAAGKHGSMGYMARNTELRTDPAKLLDGARSAIMVGDFYATRAHHLDDPLPPGRGRIARYARGRDYHKVMKKRLHRLADALGELRPGAGFRAFVDSMPVPERELAERAGLGWVGKHTLLIHPKGGSYFFLGGLLTTLELMPPPDQTQHPDHCGSCTRCIDACPTDAITPYSVDGSRCISYLTIERREPVPPEFYGALGEWLFGCDICQQVCPHNSARTLEQLPGFVRTIDADYTPRRDSLDLNEVLGWDAESRLEAIAGTPLTRATLEMIQRSAGIVAGNQ